MQLFDEHKGGKIMNDQDRKEEKKASAEMI